MKRTAAVAIAILIALSVPARADNTLGQAEEALKRFIASEQPARAPALVWGRQGFEVHDGPPFYLEVANAGSYRVLSAPVVTPDQVHFIIGRSGKDPDSGASADEFRMYVVLTRRDGEWAVQFTVPLSDSDLNADSTEAAKSTIDSFFTAWSAADNDAVHRSINFPHVFLVREGRASIARTPDELITDFDGLREREGWAKSEYHGFEVVHADDTKVIAKLTFTRHHTDGAVYSTVPVVWVFTNQDGHWGLQVRMILPSLK